jgi:hypothetical protein
VKLPLFPAPIVNFRRRNRDGKTVTLNSFQGPFLDPRERSNMDAETSSA